VDLHGWEGWQPFTVAFLVDALVERDRVDEAARRLAERGFAGPLPEGIGFNFLLDSRASLRLAEGAWAEALTDLHELATREADRRAVNPAMCPWRSRSALALVAEGQLVEARRLADEEVELARAFGGGRALGMALRSAGLVRGDAAGVGCLQEAAAVLARSSARLEHARVLADLGTALRRCGGGRREAVRTLHRALDLATQCGAATLAGRVRDELVVAGARPRRSGPVVGVHALTPSEQRVVVMASEGLANRDIAQALFVSLKTVEMHLSHAYAKLGIRSRVQLAGVLTTATHCPHHAPASVVRRGPRHRAAPPGIPPANPRVGPQGSPVVATSHACKAPAGTGGTSASVPDLLGR